MQLIKCEQCGNQVRVAGMGAICPHCGAMVAVPGVQSAEPVPVEPVEEDRSILNLLEEDAPPPPPPEPMPIRQSPEWQMFEQRQKTASTGAYWAVGILGVLVVVLVATLLVILNTRPRTITVTVPAPAPAPAPAPQRTVAPTARGSDWFVDPNATPPPGQPATRPGPASASPPPTPRQQVAVAVPAAPPASAPAPPATRPAGPHAALADLQPRPPAVDPRAVTDEQIASAIRKGSAYLLSQFAQTRLRGADNTDPETFAGMNALATYALLQCGKSLNDQRLSPQNELVRNLLERLKEYPMRGNRATYSRSLRISALTVHTRPEDRPAINEDLQWLLRSSMGGAYSYDMPPQGRLREHNVWDNSNSQYGALGVWAAAEAGFPVPAAYWQGVEQHWTSTQLVSGGWAYAATHRPATLSMTAAGTNMLFVARDQLAANSASPTALSTHLVRALEWLDEGDHAINLPTERRGYALYSLERAGLASGLRYFGTHDWYLNFSRELVGAQAADGSWAGTDGAVVETSFNLLFLLRGRDPILYSKLRFDGAWNNRPREVSVLTRFTSHQLERPHNWQVADIQRNWWDWMDAPVLLITSDKAITVPDSGVERLRAYAQNGGLIFFHTERESSEFKTSARELAQRLFPDLPLQPLAADHPIYSSVLPLDPKPPLEGAGNGSRLLVVYSPTDLTRTWQVRPGRTQKLSSELGMNIGVYAAGRRDLGSRLLSIFVPEPEESPIGRVPLARIEYTGNWNPEPAGWTRIGRLLQHSTGIGIEIRPTPVMDLKIGVAPIAHLTGTEAVSFSELQITELRSYVIRGGILLIDAAGGAKAFADSIDPLVRRLAINAVPNPMADDHPIQTGSVPGARPLPRVQLRENVPADDAMPRIVRIGAGFIIYTPHDLSSGMVGVNTIGISGYQPEWCRQFAQNLVLWVTRHSAVVPAVPQ